VLFPFGANEALPDGDFSPPPVDPSPSLVYEQTDYIPFAADVRFSKNDAGTAEAFFFFFSLGLFPGGRSFSCPKQSE